VLDGCTVGTTWELLTLLRDALGLRSKSGMRYQSNTQHRKLSSPRVLKLVSRLLIHEVLGGCPSWSMGRCEFANQQNAQYESNRRNSNVYIPSSHLHLHSLCFPHYTHRQYPELSRHHETGTKQPLSFQNTPNNLHNFVPSLWASFRYVLLYHNANASDLDWFSTRSDGTNRQPQRQGEGKC